MNSDLSTDNDIVMMALLIDQLGNNQTQDSFSTNGIKKLKKKGPWKQRKTLKDEYDVAITAAWPGGKFKGQFAACSCYDNICSFLKRRIDRLFGK